MRRKLSSLALAVLVALATAGVATAANGGFSPVEPASPNAHHIQGAYYLILGFTAAIFVLVESLLVIFIVKYRSRGRARAVEGAQVHGHTRLELIWTAFPVVILAIIAGFVFYELPNVDSAPAAADPIHVTVEGHQYYWQFDYADSPDQARSIGTLHVPVGSVVDLKVVSPDVIHSWWVPALGGKLDAIPGKTNFLTMLPTKLGTFRGQCAELCGVQHAAMLAQVEVLPAAEFDSWVQSRVDDRAALGKETFEGVCAKCHGLAGQGDIGPNIAASALLKDPRALSKVIREGTGKMPAVGDDWTQGQMAATIAYLQRRFAQGGGSGGGQG